MSSLVVFVRWLLDNGCKSHVTDPKWMYLHGYSHKVTEKWFPWFRTKVQELIPDNGQRDQLFDALRLYQASQDLHQLLVDLRQLLDEPDKLELFEFIRPLVLLRHQMEYSYLTPPAPGVRLRTIRLHRSPSQSLGFAVRGGYEFNVGVFVSKVEPGTQAEKQGLKVGDEIIRVNGFTIAEAIHDDVLNLIKSRDEIVLKVTHIGMLPVKEHASDAVTWQYVEDMDSKKALDEVLAEKRIHGGKGVELKIFVDCTGYDSIGCGILSGPHYYPGIFVEKVRPGSLAQEVGLEVGDQIVEVNDSSFQNIGHKEAVVVLKGSKQLNVIIRKHAGLPLFERRQNQASSRDSAVAVVSSHLPSDYSPPVSQRSAAPSRPPADDVILDEDQLIAEQLGRTSLIRKTATNAVSDSRPHHQSSAEGHMISTQAEVHSDSDSYHGSGGDSLPASVGEPLPADFPASASPAHPSHPTSPTTLPLTLPDSPDALVASTSEHLAYLTPPTTTTTNTTSSADLPPSDLTLPDDLGDPVLAALRRPSYPPDSPPWVIPHTYYSDVTIELDSTEEVPSPVLDMEEGKGERALDGQRTDAGPGAVDAGSGQTGELSPAAAGEESKVEASDEVVHSDLTAEVDQNSNVVKVGGTGFVQPESAVFVLVDDEEEVGVNTVSPEGADPLVFVPLPPPSTHPPPASVSSSGEEPVSGSPGMSPGTSRLSSILTQSPQAEDDFEAVMEFESESEESSQLGGAETEEVKDSANVGSQGEGEGGGWHVTAVGGMDRETSAETHQACSAGTEILEDHDLPPPPASFFEEESDDNKDMTLFLVSTSSDETAPMHTTRGSEDPLSPLPPQTTPQTLPPRPPSPHLPSPRPPSPTPSFSLVLGGAAAALAARREAQAEERSPRLLGPAEPALGVKALGDGGGPSPHDLLAAGFNPLELDGRELKAFQFPKDQSLGVAMEGGTGTPLAGRIVVAAVFGSGAAVEHGLQTGDQLMMINDRKLTDVSVTEAEQILEDAYSGPKDMIQVVYAQSNFLNDEECVTYF